MTITVRLNFAEPPALAARLARLVGINDLGNTQKMASGKPDDHSLVINVNPLKHCNPDGTLKKLDELINDSSLPQEDREAFSQLKSADIVELLGHGAPGGDAIYSNPFQNRIGQNGTNWYGETEYKIAGIGKFLADCDKGPAVNVISCSSASTIDSESICTRLRGALNQQAKLNKKSTGKITGYTKSCGVDETGKVFLCVTPKEERQCSWWAQIPIIGMILLALMSFLDFFIGRSPNKGTEKYNSLKANADEHVLTDNNCVTAPQRETTLNVEERVLKAQEEQPALMVDKNNKQSIPNVDLSSHQQDPLTVDAFKQQYKYQREEHLIPLILKEFKAQIEAVTNHDDLNHLARAIHKTDNYAVLRSQPDVMVSSFGGTTSAVEAFDNIVEQQHQNISAFDAVPANNL